MEEVVQESISDEVTQESAATEVTEEPVMEEVVQESVTEEAIISSEPATIEVASPSGIGNVSKFYFDENGYMLIGLQWIKDADGIYRQYFFNDENGSLLGACLMGGTKDDKILNEKGQVTGYVTKPTK